MQNKKPPQGKRRVINDNDWGQKNHKIPGEPWGKNRPKEKTNENWEDKRPKVIEDRENWEERDIKRKPLKDRENWEESHKKIIEESDDWGEGTLV